MKSLKKKTAILVLLCTISLLLPACGKQTKSDIFDGEINVPEIENPKDYVTPEMYGAVGDGKTDDTMALLYAFNAGKNVELLSDYYTKSGFRIETTDLVVNGNGHSLIVEASTKLHPAIYLHNAENIELNNLKVTSTGHTEKPVDIGTHKALDNQKSSNTYGLAIADCKSITVNNLATDGLMYDIFIKRSEDISVNNWLSTETLMGIYADDTKNLSVSDFSITMSPENTFSGCHAVYLCYGTDTASFANGNMVFEAVTAMQKTPVFTCHTTDQIPDARNISVSNVSIKGHWLLQISNCQDAIRFENCSLETIFPDDAVQAVNIGQVNTECDAEFTNCSFLLDSYDYGFYNCIASTTLTLTNCRITDKALSASADSKRPSGQKLFVGNDMKVIESGNSISWKDN